MIEEEKDHERWEEELSAYLDGELEAEQRAALERHLAGCASCRELMAQLQRTQEQLSSLRRAPAPVGFVRQVQSTIEKRSRGRYFRRRAGLERIPFEALAVTMLIVLAVMLMLSLDPGISKFTFQSRPGTGEGTGSASPAEDSWKLGEGGRYLLWIEPAVSAPVARRTIGEIALELKLQPPQTEPGVLRFHVPRSQVGALLERAAEQLRLRVERIPAADPGEISVEFHLPPEG